MSHRVSAVVRRAHWVLTTFPSTIAIMSLILVIAYLTAGTSIADHRLLLDHVGLDLGKVLNWQLWSLPASTVVQSHPGISAPLALFIAVSLASIEYIAGSVRAALTFFLSDWVSAPLTILVAWLLAHLGVQRAYVVLYRPDTGSSAAALGVLAATMVFLPERWRLTSLGAMFAVLLGLLPTPGLSANLAHLLGALAGMVFGSLWAAQLPERRWRVDRLTAAVDAVRNRLRSRQSPFDV